ncbi:MAG: hypothetical protein ACK5NN_13175 [Sphingomonadaceae bacterium]
MKIQSKCPSDGNLIRPKLAPTPAEMYPLEHRYVRDSKPDHSDVRIIRASDGGALRTFNGGLAHENGWFASRKARRLLHYEGVTQLAFIMRAEVEHSVVRMATEAVRFEFSGDDGKETYTSDVELVDPDGISTIVEIKRDRRDLGDPAYRAKLARVKRICDEQGMRFRVVFKDEIWVSIVHRRNAVLFASRAFTTILPQHLRRLDKHIGETDGYSAYGDLADALEPNNRRYGEAVVQALTVARRIEIDLTRPIFDATEVTIH